jgi:putative transposase
VARRRAAARRFFAQALNLVGQAPEQVTTDGHDAYPRAIRETLGDRVIHRTSRYKNNRIEQDHRGVQQRYHPLRGFGAFMSAARFCSAFEEQRQHFRVATRSSAYVSPGDRRCLFRDRRATVMAALAAA